MNRPMPSPPGPDPLADLRDIHMPPPVDAWPPAPGWWILGILALAALAAVALWWLRRRRANRYRRQALKELLRLYRAYEHHRDTATWLREFEALLKRVALTRYPREDVASLTGESWVAFLDKTGGSNDFRMGAGQALIDGIYKPPGEHDNDVDVRRLHELGRQWIKYHGNPEAA